MNYSNYTLFEILKYKMELLDCLEYSMETYTLNEKEVEQNFTYLKNNLLNGTYKEIICSLFTNYKKINDPLFIFFKEYTPNKIIKMINSKKSRKKITFIKLLIDCHNSLNNIIYSFLNEEGLKNKIEYKITSLILTHNKHFINFLFFVLFNMYYCSLNQNQNNLLFKEKDLKDIASMIKYCNADNLFDESIKILEENIEMNVTNEIKKISNKCIDLEKKQNLQLKEIIASLNQEVEKDKK